jgi:hypothetical protein
MSIQANFPAIKPTLLLDFANVGQLDPRITFTRASTGTFTDSVGVLQTAAIDAPRFDYDPVTLACKGLLIEESRTNSIRNNTGQGAVAGTPGTLPTNWDVTSSGSGITREIVGTGTEDGIQYVDIRFFGTGSGSAIPQIRPETTTQVVAAVGQSWSASWYLRIVGGSTTGISAGTWQSIWQERDASGVSLTVVSVIVSAPTTADLRGQRLSLSRTLTDAGVARLTNRIQFSVTDGVPIDITLRIGLPQLELGAFATSVIPTTTTALTRAADVATMTGANFSNWYNQTEGTLFTQFLPNVVAPATAAQIVAMFSDATTDNTVELYKRANVDGSTRFSVNSGGVNYVFMNLGVFAQSVTKLVGAYKVDNFAGVQNAGTVIVDTSGQTANVSQLDIGRFVTGSGYLNGYLQRITYYPRRLTNSELQALTA